jgi:2-dehydropantoate 2-reductase
MKIGVLGTGAMGSAIGGLLTESGLDVLLVDPWKEHVEAMEENGLVLEEQGDKRLIRVRATGDVRNVGSVDLVILLVKSYVTERAIRDFAPLIGTDTVVLSLQNGLGNEEIIAGIIGQDRVLGGVTHAGAVLLEAGHVQCSRKGKLTYIGELDGRNTERVLEVSRLLSAAGLDTDVAEDIYEKIWSKLLVNVAVSPISAITGLSHGGMAAVPEVLACAGAAVAEAMAVARAAAVKLTTEDPSEVWRAATAGLPGEHKSSMLQDIEKGSRTEIDFINGAVARWGEKHGVPTPVNRTLVAAVKGIEYRLKAYESPRPAD